MTSTRKKQTNQLNKIKDITHDLKNLVINVGQCLIEFRNPLAHFTLTAQKAEELTTAALKTTDGIKILKVGPFTILYVVSNQARLALVRESRVGIVDEVSALYFKCFSWKQGFNQVKYTFPNFRPLNSETYAMQRQFLKKRFHAGATKRLAESAKVTTDFLHHYCKEHPHPHPLRELIIASVLHTSSYLLGINQVTLDKFYFENPKYRDAFDRVALYGVVEERANSELEKTLYQLFLQIFQYNFNQIQGDTPDTNLIRNIFASMNLAFPQKFEDFFQLPLKLRHTLAMNFIATGLGGMVHSTTSTLDWAIARLLNDVPQMNELTQLMLANKDLDITQPNVFDKTGPLFAICKLILHISYLYPPFSNELFLNRKSFAATLPNGSSVQVPNMSFIIVNYTQCNRSNEQMVSPHTFPNFLEKESTVGKFMMHEQVASFGGCKVNRENPDTRFCPAAKTTLYSEMIFIAILLRDCSLALTDSKEIPCEADQQNFPLLMRVNKGNIVIKTNSPSPTPQLPPEIKVINNANPNLSKDTLTPAPKTMANQNAFFNRANTAKLLRTGLTMGAAFVLHNLTL